MADINHTADDDGIESVDQDVTDDEIEREAASAKPRALVVVDNLDDAERVRFWIRFDAKVKRAIARAYKRLDVTPSAGDRLTRADTGESAFADESLSIRAYILKYGGKARVHWEYAGDTGGA